MYNATRPQVARLMKIDQAIRAGKCPTAAKLGELLEASRRTVMRDIDFMKHRLGAPVDHDRQRNGYVYTDDTWVMPNVVMTEGELVAVFLGEQLLRHIGNHPYADELTSALAKLQDRLPDTVTIDLAQLSGSLSVRPTPAISIKDADVFRQLHQALRRSRQLEIRYWSASTEKERTRTVDPYHLLHIDGDWFLVAYCYLRKDIRLFAVARIRELKENDKTAFVPDDFSIRDYMASGFRKMRGTGKPTRVRLRFTSEVAKYVREKTWHPSQKIEAFLDGTIIVTLRVNHLLEVKRWALSFGGDCEVLAPKRLRNEVRAEAVRILNVLKNTGE